MSFTIIGFPFGLAILPPMVPPSGEEAMHMFNPMFHDPRAFDPQAFDPRAFDPQEGAARTKGVEGYVLDTIASSERCLDTADFAKNKDCVVCLNELHPGEGGVVLPDCHHVFHKGCIVPWLEGNDSCPLCRATVNVAPPRACKPWHEGGVLVPPEPMPAPEVQEQRKEDQAQDDFENLSVSELKERLDRLGVSYAGMIDKKEDLVRLLRCLDLD